MSRTKNSLNNTMAGMLFRIVTMVLHFATRTIFVRYLGNEFLSVNGLISSVLSFLNIAELGIGSALVFEMYKPIAEGNEEKTKQYMRFYKQVYTALGLGVLGVGILLAPVCLYMLAQSEEVQTVNCYWAYALYLANSVSSYFFFTPQGGFLAANQEEYRLVWSNCITTIAQTVLQIVALAVFKNYYVYIAVPTVAMILQRIVNGLMIQKWHPYIRTKSEGRLSRDEKHHIVRNTFGLAIAKICTIVNNALGDIVITAVVSLAAVGHYSNYKTVITMLSGTTSIIFTAMRPSVGNLSAVGSVQDKKRVFQLIYFVGFWIYGFSAISYVAIINPFVAVWVGEQYVMPIALAIAVGVNFLVTGMDSAISTFREGCGLYYEGRYRPIFTTVLNILLAFLLGSLWDVTGIVLAAAVSRLLTIWWFDAYLVYNRVFRQSPLPYLLDYLGKLALLGAIGVLVLWLCSLVTVESLILVVLIRAGICTVVINAVILLLYGRTAPCRELWRILRGLLHRRSAS